MVILFVGGCKKEISTSEDLDKPDVIMGTGGKGVSTKVLRQSPGLKVEMKSKSSKRVYPTLQGKEKLTELLNGLNKKKKAEVITTSWDSATFSATLYASMYYACTVDFLDPTGTKDFYIVNENTWVFTYIGSTSEPYATFAINKPSMYGSYRIWIEGGDGNQFSNPLYLGDPYSGVSLANGVFTFSDETAYTNLHARLSQAYEAHQAGFFDVLSTSWTDDQINAYAESAGFDEFLPFKEFEAYWGFSSLRALIQSDVDTWLSTSHTDMSGYPEDNYFVDDEAKQTLFNTSGVVTIGEVNWEVPVLMPAPSVGELGCIMTDRMRGEDPYASNRVLKKRIILDGKDCVQSTYCPSAPDVWFKGKALTFKKSGLFKKFATKMQVRLHGKAYNNVCNLLQNYDTGFTQPYSGSRYRIVVEKPFPNTNFIGTKANETTVEVQLIGNTYSMVYVP